MTLALSHAAIVGLAISIAAGPVMAQDDWDVVERPGYLSASLVFDSDIAVAVRCDDGQLETYIAGLDLPRAAGNRQTIQYALGDRPMRDSSWQTSRDGRTLFADVPASLARQFRSGGDLQLRISTTDDQSARRHVVSLPVSPAAIDRVLAACDRPAHDPYDELRESEAAAEPLPGPSGPSWEKTPQARYPGRALNAGRTGMAVLSCLVEEDGGLKGCQIEVERPAGADFGRAAIRATQDARLARRNPPISGVVTFTIRFNLPRR